MSFTDEIFNFITEPEKYLIFHGVIRNSTNHSETKIIPFVKCDYEKHFKKTELSKGKVEEKISNFNKTSCLDLNDDFHLINSGNEIPGFSFHICYRMFK